MQKTKTDRFFQELKRQASWNSTSTLIYLGIIFLLAGCNRGNDTSVTGPAFSPSPSAAPSFSTVTVKPEQASTSLGVMATKTFPLTRTPIPARADTPIPTNTGVPEAPAEARLHFQCLEVAETLPAGFRSSGIVVLRERDQYGRVILLDMSTGQSVSLGQPEEILSLPFISPNRELMAYETSSLDSISTVVIARSDGQPIRTMQSREWWGRWAGWLDNERLIINIAPLDPDENEARKPATLLALNPFTGDSKTLPPDFPKIYSQIPVPSWGAWSLTTYDSTLSRVAYFLDDEDGLALALWDMQKQTILAKLTPYRGYMPVWSPDGLRLVTVLSDPKQLIEYLALMSRDGQIERLTEVQIDYKGWSDSFVEYIWSPDGQSIAALTEKDNLFILNTVTREIIGYCIKYHHEAMTKLVWSPDGKQLLLYDPDGKGHSQIILIDLAQGLAGQLAADMELAGWMVAPTP